MLRFEPEIPSLIRDLPEAAVWYEQPVKRRARASFIGRTFPTGGEYLLALRILLEQAQGVGGGKHRFVVDLPPLSAQPWPRFVSGLDRLIESPVDDRLSIG
ncbi:MAG: hypothetical protein JWN52_1984 [Actinomycetia bacterium]|nr:hypothetical protein [Actinomycetes bacterium]